MGAIILMMCSSGRLEIEMGMKHAVETEKLSMLAQSKTTTSAGLFLSFVLNEPNFRFRLFFFHGGIACLSVSSMRLFSITLKPSPCVCGPLHKINLNRKKGSRFYCHFFFKMRAYPFPTACVLL